MIIERFLLFGILGWAFERLKGPSESEVMSPEGSFQRFRETIPFRPVYGVGGVLIGLIAPGISHLPAVYRALVYGVTLSGLEFAACQVDRQILHQCSWDYSGQVCEHSLSGCTSIPHGILWGTLGLGVEHFMV